MAHQVGQNIYDAAKAKADEIADPLDKIIHGYEMEDLEIKNPFGDIPSPPKFILDRLEARDLAWRWMALKHADKLGMREYTTYSPSGKDRDIINSGRFAAIRISADNRVTWREDAFLAVIPKARLERRRRDVQERTRRQSLLAQASMVPLDKDTKASVTVQQWKGSSES